jgi:diacylglycerol kinase (ATP)
MRTFILFNPNAGSALQATALREALACRSDVTLREPGSKAETTALAAEAVRANYDLVVAAGGDGTIHATVNGLATDFGRARLGILPLGTGNDFRRTLAIPDDPLEALAVLTTGAERALDVIRVETANQSLYAINAAAGGFSGQLQEVLTDEMKQTWGPLAYLRAAAGVLPDLTGYETTVRFDDGSAERVEALNLIVANGRTAAGGIQVASQANPEDGLLDVVIVPYAPLLDLTAVATRLLAGDYLNSELVLHRRARRVQVASRPGMWFSIDGELLGNELVTFTAQPRALRLIVGPDYTPSPALTP